jgi:hypothetical protein
VIEQVVVAGNYRLRTRLTGEHDQIVVGRITQNGRGISRIVEHDSGIADDRDGFRNLLILDQLAEIRLSERTLNLD